MRRGRSFEGLHAASDAALGTEVGDGAAAVLFAQHLLAVVDDAVDQFAGSVVIDARVAFVGDAKLAVEVACDHHVAVHHLEHDLAQEDRSSRRAGPRRTETPVCIHMRGAVRKARAKTMAAISAQRASPMGNS